MTRFLPRRPLSERWLKAAVVGSLWAAVEIILGSLLHNMRIPLAGSLLSFATVYLVISFYQLWPLPGLIWRAGLICALMKSISPSAIVIGPMIGIFSEALLLEVVVRLLGSHPVAFAFAGALAVFSALAQKAITLLVLYGWDIVLLLENMVDFAVSQTGFSSMSAPGLLLLLSGIYLGAGAFAALLGYRAGQGFLKKTSASGLPFRIEPQVQSELFRHTRKKRNAIPFLLIILALLVTGMWVITRAPLEIAFFYTLGFLTLMFLRYRPVMGYLKKPALWMQLLVILAFSGIFYGGVSADRLFEAEGLVVGIQMIFRALVLLTSFSAISAEMKNPAIKNLLYKRGLRNVYQAVDLAFSALPAIIDAFRFRGLGLKTIRKLVFDMLGSAQALLNEMMQMEANKPVIFILSGEVHSGKTSAAKKVVGALRSHGFRLRGFFSAGNTDGSDRSAYYLEDVCSGERKLLCSENPVNKGFRAGRFYFSGKAIAWGRLLLERSVYDAADFVVVDEIGPLELRDGGWAPAIGDLLARSRIPHIWVVRKRLADLVARKWNAGDVYIFDLEEDRPGDIVDHLLSFSLKDPITC
ncbi:MAG: nucleoside-triphosphatase [Bacteroidales bacterium]